MKLSKNPFLSVAMFLALSVSSSALIAADHGAHHDQKGDGHGMHEENKHGVQMGDHEKAAMREVAGEGRLNKIMAKHRMVNINHETIPEMYWPKMRMNFKVVEDVDLGKLNLGDEVEFTLMVDDANNYVITDIKTK